ncbi:hypothetical protein FHL15_009927 [Xylaria flabelliformis]|uniref:Beta-lactamase-related domain-containing protein n=1 Tax=Xylaria flabelliformis TaxID=2512241 RepID=A0A553HMP2_9PEZI|nr:hypothetical protein FHL15_009927 [Xylaria flabelliformis]
MTTFGGFFFQNPSNVLLAGTRTESPKLNPRIHYKRLNLQVLKSLTTRSSGAFHAQTSSAVDLISMATDPIKERLLALDPAIRKICDVAGAPGVSYGVTRNGEVIHRGNYGFKDVQALTPTTSDTVYLIGTMAKALTASAVGILVDEGRLSWSTRIKDILPDFRSQSATITENLTIVDLLSHRTGLARSNLWWQGADGALFLNKSDLLPFYASLEPTGDFRASWAYSNWGYAVVGSVVEKLTGIGFGQYLEEALFRPLGMKNTSFAPLPLDDPRLAKPYAAMDDASPHPMPMPPVNDNTIMTSAMGGHSSAEDLLIYSNALLQAYKNEKKGAKSEVLRYATMQLSGHISTAHSILEKSYAFGFYRTQLPNTILGMGWNSIYVEKMPTLVPRGHAGPVIAHGGSLPGYHVAMALVPELDSSVVVCTNSIALGDVSGWVSLAVLEALIENPRPSNFVDLATRAARSNAESVVRFRRQLESQKRSKDNSHKALASYTGRYRHPSRNWTIHIRIQSSQLEVLFQGLESQAWRLHHYESNTFLWLADREEQARRGRMTTYPLVPSHFKLTFQENSVGQIDRLIWAHETGVPLDQQPNAPLHHRSVALKLRQGQMKTYFTWKCYVMVLSPQRDLDAFTLATAKYRGLKSASVLVSLEPQKQRGTMQEINQSRSTTMQTQMLKQSAPRRMSTLPRLGSRVPDVPHAVSVQLPKWQDMIDFAQRTKRIANVQKSGYPRSFLHSDVQKVHDFFANQFGQADEICFVFSSKPYATSCLSYVCRSAQGGTDAGSNPTPGRVQSFTLEIDHTTVSIHAVFLPRSAEDQGMAFWRLTGSGISSRLSEDLLHGLETAKTYSLGSSPIHDDQTGPCSQPEHSAYSTIRGRVASLLERAPVGGSRSTLTTADDVFLYSTGMSAIYNLTTALRDWPGTKSVVFGFPYELTLKIQQDFAKSYVFYGFGTLSEMELLEDYLHMLMQQGTTIQAVWCECASNPLLRTVDLNRLRRLADRYGFVVIVDDTIGGVANVDLLGVADIVVSSLTKSFSGLADVMGGCIALNPRSPFYARLRAVLLNGYSNDLYYRDAVKLEANSRGYLPRAAKMNENTAQLISFLLPFVDDPKTPLRHIYHPSTCTWSTSNYEALMRPPTDEFRAGHGSLFTLDFDTTKDAAMFFDVLDVCKGPSLGAEVTLAQPYVQTVFYKEKAWAARYGLRESIIRISVGVEDPELLVEAFSRAMTAVRAQK